MRLLLCYFTLYFSTLPSYSQILFGTEAVPASSFSKWPTETLKTYESIYHFGVSEAESDFALVIDEGVVTAQIRSGEWATKPERWRKVYKTLTNARIVGNKFYSKEAEGDFVTFPSKGKKIYGLKICKPWSASLNEGQLEVGVPHGATY